MKKVSKKTKKYLANQIHKKTFGMQNSLVFQVMSRIISLIKEELKENRTVSVQNFGTFAPSWRESRVVRQVHTGEWLPSERKRIVRFYPHYNMIEMVHKNGTWTRCGKGST
jgi:nucleoid DNA-binding protein